MVGHGSKQPRKKAQAIAALLGHPSVAEAAGAIDVAPQTLNRWLSEPEFSRQYRAARRAEYRQSMTRLAQGATAAVKSALQIMYRGKKAATRFKAAKFVIRFCIEGSEIEDFAAALEEAERIVKTAAEASPSAAKKPHKGHGTKLPRKKEQAIAALLSKRNVAEAALSVDVSTQTLYNWLQDPAFLAAYAAAAGSVFQRSLMVAQQCLGDAILLIRNLSQDTGISEETRLQAGMFVAAEMQAGVVEELDARVAELEPADTSVDELPVTSKVIGRDLHERLQRIKTRFLEARGLSGEGLILVHAINGSPAGSSVRGADGRNVWWDPPHGCKKGEEVKEQDGPERDEAA
jgi:hypothetical protein